MATLDVQNSAEGIWRLVRRQHGVVAHSQLIAHGLTRAAIKHRLHCGKLIRVHHGVYVVGRAELTPRGRWMAAVLRCGPTAILSHASAAALWGVAELGGPIEVTVEAHRRPRVSDLRVHRRSCVLEEDRARRSGIPVTSPVLTLIDLAARLSERRLEAAVNAADKLDLIDPETLRAALETRRGEPGLPSLRKLLDTHTFALTDSELERRFLALVRGAGLPLPKTGVDVCGFRVDFLWPDLGLIVETDGLRYHRTPAAQSRERERDQAHAAQGSTTVRFTHAQVTHGSKRTMGTLAAVIARLAVATARKTP